LDAATMKVMARQDHAHQIGSAVEDAARTNPGLAGMRSDGKGGLEIFWRGAVPAAVLAQVNAGRNAGVAVRVFPAPFTRKELLAEVDRIMRLPLPAGVTSRRTGPRADGTGVDIGVAGPAAAQLTGAGLAKLMPALAGQRIPLTVTETPEASFMYRWIDSSPFFGGAYIEREGSGYTCSNAFGVTGRNGAGTYMVGAAHCAEGSFTSGHVSLPDNSDYFVPYGRTISRNTGRDVQLILPPDGDSAGAGVYWGDGINPDAGDLGSNYAVAVAGIGGSLQGDLVCNSGSYSGTICGLQVTGTNQTIEYRSEVNGVRVVTNLAVAVAIDNGAATGHGDSGGPVVSVTSDGRLRAVGVVSGGYGTGPEMRTCRGYTPPGRQCSRTILYADLPGALDALGARINTL
jgi:streptogrisin D